MAYHSPASDYSPFNHVPAEHHFDLTVMSMAEGDPDLFDRFMYHTPLRELYYRNALRQAATWRPLPELTT